MILAKKAGLFLAAVLAIAPSSFVEGRPRNRKPKKPRARSANAAKPKNYDTRFAGVYVQSNNADFNTLIVFRRKNRIGTLKFSQVVSTNGQGIALGAASDPLASQDSVLVTEGGKCVLCVNAGSNTVASFKIESNGYTPSFVSTVDSGGTTPVSLAQQGEFVYVLNVGGQGSFSGFTLDNSNCLLNPIAGSTVTLDQDVSPATPPVFITTPSYLAFTPAGDKLLITIKSNNYVFPPVVGEGSFNLYDFDNITGLVSAASLVQTNVTDATAPFNFDFDDEGNVLLAVAFGNQPALTDNVGTVQSYNLGDLSTPIASVNLGQTATCWVRYSSRSGCAYTANNLASTASSIEVLPGGDIQLAQPVTGSLDNPTDSTFSPDERFFYILSTGDGGVNSQPAIFVYRAKPNNSCILNVIQNITTGLPSIVDNPNGVVGVGVS